MKVMRCLSWILVAGLAFAMFGGFVSCSSGPQTCKSRSSCPEGFSCLQGLCQKKCNEDADCDEGVKCKNGYCGGIQRADSGAGDGSAQDSGGDECSNGQTRPCFTGNDGDGCRKLSGDNYNCTAPCKAGTQACENGSWGACKDEIKPTTEECNGKDDNCDGKVDEACGTTCKIGDTRKCYSSGDPKTKGVGRCKEGLQKCVKGSDGSPEWGQCEGEQLPITELCSNNEDDDCDGKVNEGCACKPGQQEKCKADGGCAGLRVCQLKKDKTTEWGKCVAGKPTPEDCNGLDDDCDGKVDNIKGSAKVLERPCTNVCFKGTEFCKNGNWKDCNAELPVAEVCNNKDDDCDGQIDNIENKPNPLVKGCDTGKKGLCKDGQSLCKAGKWGSCIAPPPSPENCNDLDDDCDGKVDEKEDKPCGGGECIKDTLGVKKCI